MKWVQILRSAKLLLIKTGKDVTIIATGYCVAEAIDAAKELEAQGISAKSTQYVQIKPIDEKQLSRLPKKLAQS